mgnify:CR=1 FL=1
MIDTNCRGLVVLTRCILPGMVERGDERRAAQDNLTIEDGWIYFLHGWTQVVAEVFDVQLTPEVFAKLDEAASELRPR